VGCTLRPKQIALRRLVANPKAGRPNQGGRGFLRSLDRFEGEALGHQRRADNWQGVKTEGEHYVVGARRQIFGSVIAPDRR
jgi:hypothetical protein